VVPEAAPVELVEVNVAERVTWLSLSPGKGIRRPNRDRVGSRLRTGWDP
jgi:hypothetical protein